MIQPTGKLLTSKCYLGIAALEKYRNILLRWIWKIQPKTNHEGKLWQKQMGQQYLM